MATLTEVIHPDDPEWMIPHTERWSISAAAAVGSDAFFLAVQLEGEIHSLADPYTRLYRYENGRWICVVLDVMITGLTAFENGMLALSELGGIWFVSDGGWTREHLPNNAARLSGELGMTTSIQANGSQAIVLGMSGQLYRREETSWRQDDSGIRNLSPEFRGKRSSDTGKSAWLHSHLANGTIECTCGNFSNQFPAFFTREVGSDDWCWMDFGEAVSIERMRLYAMFSDRHSIYIGTSIGLVVNRTDGGILQICSDQATSQLALKPAVLSCAASYQDEMYFGGNGGLFRLTKNHLDPIRGPFSIPLRLGEKSTNSILGNNIQVLGDKLWVFGSASVSRFDGVRWDRIPIPTLYK